MASDYAQAAARHYKDAELLAGAKRFDGAGHLMGLAAECAIKKAALGFFGGAQEIEGHLGNELKRTIRLALQGRNASGRLLQLVQHNSPYFEDWHINDRYSADGQVDEATYMKWKKEAGEALGMAKIRL